MIRVYPEQLRPHLDKGMREVYLLLGNDPFLLRESQNLILEKANTQGFDEHHTVQVDNSTDWQAIFNLCQTQGLFSPRQTLLLVLPENTLDAEINRQLSRLATLLHGDLLLIVRGFKVTKKAQADTVCLLRLAERAVLVTCRTPERTELPKWVYARARQNKLDLDEAACQLLCYCYEGNLSGLAQVLEQLSLLWPDGKLTLFRVEQAIHDIPHFTPYHWVESLLSAESGRALHTLQNLHLEGRDPVILLRTLQKELLFLVTLKRQSKTTPLRALFNKHRVWQNRRQAIIGQAIERLSYDQLRQAVHLLSQIELTLKQDYQKSVWAELESLSLLLCQKAESVVLISGLISVP